MLPDRGHGGRLAGGEKHMAKLSVNALIGLWTAVADPVGIAQLASALKSAALHVEGVSDVAFTCLESYAYFCKSAHAASRTRICAASASRCWPGTV